MSIPNLLDLAACSSARLRTEPSDQFLCLYCLQDTKGVECVFLLHSIRSVVEVRESLVQLDRLGNQQGCRAGHTNGEPAVVLRTQRAPMSARRQSTSAGSRPGVAVIKVALDGGGQTITASITREAIQDLGLAEGTPVTVLVKSTDVSLAVE